jgi:DNA-binding MarR family transcriptional regulator
MGIFDNLGGGGNKVSSRHWALSDVAVLTEQGKKKAEQFDMPGRQWKVLAILNENGPSSVRDLANEMGMEESKARAICESLCVDKYIQKSGAGGS